MSKIHTRQKSSGFTIVELIVSMVVASIVGVVLVSVLVSWTQQFAIANVRQDLNTNAQAAISRINDDIRNSDSISLYNSNPDPNAPTALVGDYANVPGPTGPGTQNYNWRFGSSRLILSQPARDANGNAIYTNPALFIGPKNTIVYYIKNNALYRRLIAAPGAAASTVMCTPAESDGGCTTGSTADTKIIDNLRTLDGSNPFVINYIDKAGNKITTGSSGNTNQDYSAYLGTRLVSVNVKQTRQQSGQTVIESKGANTAFRSVPPISAPTDQPYLNGSIVAGPGGLNGFSTGAISGLKVFTQGAISVTYGSTIGSPSRPLSVNAANKGCGSGSDYGTVTCSSEPVNIFAGGHVYGDTCATGQTTTSFFGGTIEPGSPGTQYTRGLIPSCAAPDASLPAFNKSAFVASLPTVASGSSAYCNGNTGPVTSTLNGGTTYDSDVTFEFGCTATLKCNSSNNANVYIKGSLTIKYGAKLKVDGCVTSRPTIVVNGGVTLFSTANIEPGGSSGSIAPLIISFDSSNSTCSNSNTCDTIARNGDCTNLFSCTSIGNAELATSVGRNGIAITYGASAPRTIFYAYFTSVQVFSSGEVKAGALAGQGITFSYGSTITTDQ